MNGWLKYGVGLGTKMLRPRLKKIMELRRDIIILPKKKAKNKFLEIINTPIYSNQSIARDVNYGELSHKRTIFVGKYEYKGKWFVIHYDLGFEYPDKSAEYYFTEGDNSCDCNVSSIIRWEYGEDAIPELDCGDEIKLVAYKIEHYDSYYQRFDGDDLMWRVSLNEIAKS